MTTQYKKFIKLIAKWPLDATKGDRDFAQHIRGRVKAAFDINDPVNLNSELCNKEYNALNRLADNTYRNKYKTAKQSTSTGLSTEECNVVLSTEALKYLEDDSKGFMSKLFTK